MPPTSREFADASFADLLFERYEDLYLEMQQVIERLGESSNSGEMQALQSRLSDIQRALREPVEMETGDPLIDEWERDIAEGRTPDLTKGMARKG